jgi:hypothetical protein
MAEILGQIHRGHAARPELALETVPAGQGGRELLERRAHAVCRVEGIRQA